MSLPTQYELVSLFYQAQAVSVAKGDGKTDTQILNDVKARWQQSANKLRQVTDEREYEMTSAEITQNDLDIDANGVTSLQELKPIWEAELAAELAGFNRPEVIAELEANIASVPVV